MSIYKLVVLDNKHFLYIIKFLFNCMIPVPVNLLRTYREQLHESRIDATYHTYFLKWFRYYYDFCLKYSLEGTDPETRVSFRKKLRSKGQAPDMVRQANEAVGIYLELVHARFNGSVGSALELNGESQPDTRKESRPAGEISKTNKNIEKNSPSQPATTRNVSRQQSSIKTKLNNTSVTVTDTGADWTKLYGDLSSAIQVRHYSPKTLKSYRSWIRQFQTFVKSKDASLISVDDVKAFLTWLAVERHVSASSQNLAFNSLLFFFRNVLGKEFGKIEGVVRAKKRPYIPVVLDRAEVDQIVAELSHPYNLIVKLLYGCGLRLFECLQLRIQCFNFSAGVLTIHDGKGKKDRTVPIPEILVPQLKEQMNKVGIQHQQDIEANYDGVFLFDAIEVKYKNAARELIWQWMFPAQNLTQVKDSEELRRYHIHPSLVQKAIRKAVQKTKVPKRVTAHTFRHSFASHLLQANYDIRTIQELLGHSNVRTTMIYTHTVRSRTLKEARSPLDF